jgi:hypothetical protein
LWKNCEEKDGIAMESPLELIAANYFMENFEKQVLDTTPR